jgi:protein TonB
VRRALALSVAAHLAAGMALVLRPFFPAVPPRSETTAEMVFVYPWGAQAALQRPLPRPPPAAPAQPPQPQPAEAAAAPPQPVAPDAEALSQPAPPQPAPPQPAPPQPAPPHTEQAALDPAARRDTTPGPEPSIRLGDDDGAGSTDDVTGDDTSVGPDPSAPNIPPRYPLDAARRGEQGSVLLQVTVSPGGEASAVAVFVSSGFPTLDRAAQGAVARWRFVPKREEGRPTEAHTLVRVTFKLD